MYIITIDTDLCQGDGECVESCPADILKLQTVDGKSVAAVIGNLDECLGCEACITVCETGAITLQEM